MLAQRHQPPGFMVWNPDGRMPTAVHPTLKSAAEEAARLKRAHRGERFYVMVPVLGEPEFSYARGLNDGKAEGLAQAHREIMDAEAKADRLSDALDLERFQSRMARKVIERADAFRSVVADCLCWFAGFDAAHSYKESWERPWAPERATLRELNTALQEIAGEGTRPAALSEEIPF